MPKLNWKAISVLGTVAIAIVATLITFSFASGGLVERVNNEVARSEKMEKTLNQVLDEVRYVKAFLQLHLDINTETISARPLGLPDGNPFPLEEISLEPISLKGVHDEDKNEYPGLCSDPVDAGGLFRQGPEPAD